LTERERVHGGGTAADGRHQYMVPHTFSDVDLVSWRPRVAVYHGFLSAEECDHLIGMARKRLTESTVVDNVSGASKPSEARTSTGMFLNRAEDEVVRAIEQRIAEWTMTPEENGEPLQVLNYLPGQEYRAHHDYFVDPVHTKRGGQRIATVLMYLADVEGGGETVFPKAVVEGGGHRKVIGADSTAGEEEDAHSTCADKGLVVHPKRGDAILFWSTDFEGHEMDESLHASCPVTAGEKWTSTRWIRQRKFV